MERKFWEFWGDLEERYHTLKRILYILSAVLAVLSYTLLRVTLSPQPVIVVPGATEVGMYLPGEIPDRIVVDFARNFVTTLGNYTPATAEAAFAQVRKYMAPDLLSRFDGQVDSRLQEIRSNQLSQMFSVESYRYSRSRNLFSVVFLGRRAVYVGKYEIENLPYRYTVGVSAAEPTDTNPYGLVISSLRQAKAITDKKPPQTPGRGES